MKRRYTKIAALLLCTFALGSYLFAGGSSPKDGAMKDGAKDSVAAPVVPITDVGAMRLQGEQRFHANCGRCHAAPQKFPPRMMKTVLRHMRVRATITDEDMRLILSYMTQ
jgi:mono/diheme cytochrome c family protein